MKTPSTLSGKTPNALSAIPYVILLSLLWLRASLWLDALTSDFLVSWLGGGLIAALVTFAIRDVIDRHRARRLRRLRREQFRELHLVNAGDEPTPRRKPVQSFYREQRSRAAR